MSDLFNTKQCIDKDNLFLDLQPEFLNIKQADFLLNFCQTPSNWEQGKLVLFNKKINEPRLSLFFADNLRNYKYSGRVLIPLPMPKVLTRLKNKIEKESGLSFNSVFINYYRHQQDYMGWHQDNEKELGSQPNIASLSLGQERLFCLREINNHSNKVNIILHHGDLLIMKKDTQTYWQHSLPKSQKELGIRFNLTFRFIHSA